MCIFVEFWKDLQYPFSRVAKPGFICDIQDGKLYKNLQKPGKFLSYPEHTGLVLNTDGVAIFKSSKHSLWPVYLSITSLPPELRMRKDFILLAGVWCGPSKPDLNAILKPTLEDIHQLNSLGIDVSTSDGMKKVRAMLLLSVFDLPAKAAAVNMKQFNGKYGCLYCDNPGETFSPGCTIYRPDVLCARRTHQAVQQHAEEAKQLGVPVKGIKGESILSKYTDIVNSIPVDYMHAVLEGVTKQLTSMWFNSKYHKHSFYLGNRVKEVDDFLLQIKPPSSQVRRSPRPIRTSLKFWKAGEYRSWLLLPILQHFLPSEYVHHWSLLVFAIHTLLGDEIPGELLLIASEALQSFCQLVPELYGLQSCTANMHSLLHLTDCVNDWGPLWTYSLFGFENMNGHVRKTFHGTRQILDQLVFSIKAEQSLFFQIKEHSAEVSDSFLSSYNNHYESRVCFEGKSKKVVLSTKIHDVLQRFTGTVLHKHRNVVSRLRINHIVLHSEYFLKQNRVSDSCVCSFQNSQGELSFARILVFDASLKIAVAYLYVPSVQKSLVETLRKPRKPQLQHLQDKLKFENYFHLVSTSNSLIAIPITNIINVCVYLKIQNTEIICLLPNNNEFH